MTIITKEKYFNFLDKIITHTDSGKFAWKYLDENLDIISLFKNKTRPKHFEAFDSFKPNNDISFNGHTYKANLSYYFENLDYTLVFLCDESGNLCLVVAAAKSLRNSITLDDSEYGVHLVKLLAKIKNQFPNPEAFIEMLLNEDNPDAT